MKAGKQTSLRTQATVHGIGVHSGAAASLTLLPAAANTGIVFVRTGRTAQPDRRIRADVRAVTATEFATVLGDATGPLCSTAEHILAALAGLGIDNAVVEIDGPEVPIMDGSAAPFVAAIDAAGIVMRDAPKPLYQGSQAGLRDAGRRVRRIAAAQPRLPARGRDRLRPPADRPPGHRAGGRIRTVSAASFRGRGPSASCAT